MAMTEKRTDISNLTFYRGDWYSACYNYYNGQFYDYYETMYYTKVNETKNEIAQNYRRLVVPAGRNESNSTNGTV